MAEPLRAHHLLCTILYQGQGYDRDFEGNMGRIASRICRQKELRLRLLDSPDGICGECPNLTVQGCGLEGNSVAATDRQVLSLLGLSPGQELSAGECRGLLRERLTGESFE